MNAAWSTILKAKRAGFSWVDASLVPHIELGPRNRLEVIARELEISARRCVYWFDSHNNLQKCSSHAVT